MSEKIYVSVEKNGETSETYYIDGKTVSKEEFENKDSYECDCPVCTLVKNLVDDIYDVLDDREEVEDIVRTAYEIGRTDAITDIRDGLNDALDDDE